MHCEKNVIFTKCYLRIPCHLICTYELQHSLMLCKLPVFLLNPSGNSTQEANAVLIHANSVVIINSRHPLENMEKSRSSDRQGRINHWANWANARGLALECQNTPLLIFHVFRLFTTRQNCRAFRLLRLVQHIG